VAGIFEPVFILAIDNLRLLRMKLQPTFLKPLRYSIPNFLSLASRPAMHEWHRRHTSQTADAETANEDDAQIPFDNILDRVTGSDPSVTDYILEQPAKCPNCRREIREKTLIEPE
jgi:hypothetical protein